MRALRILSLAACSAIMLAGCKKDDPATPTPPAPVLTKEQKLVGNDWVVVMVTIDPPFDFDGDGVLDTDLMNINPACKNDDILDLNSDGTYTLDEGPTKCDPNDPQIIQSGTWTCVNGDTEVELTFMSNGNTVTSAVPITSLTASQWVSERTFDPGTGTTHTITTTSQ